MNFLSLYPKIRLQLYDPTHIYKQILKDKIYKGVKNTDTDIKKMSQIIGGQCSLGFIYNGKGLNVAEKTDNFLTGGAWSISATIRNIRLGVTSPLDKDFLNLKTPKAIEVGYSTEKLDIDAGASITIPLIKTPIKY